MTTHSSTSKRRWLLIPTFIWEDTTTRLLSTPIEEERTIHLHTYRRRWPLIPILIQEEVTIHFNKYLEGDGFSLALVFSRT